MPTPISELTTDQIRDILHAIKTDPATIKAYVDGKKDRAIVGVCHEPSLCLVAQVITDQLVQAIRFSGDTHYRVTVGWPSVGIMLYHNASSQPFVRREFDLDRSTTNIIDEFDEFDRSDDGREHRVTAGRVRRQMRTLYPEAVS